LEDTGLKRDCLDLSAISKDLDRVFGFWFSVVFVELKRSTLQQTANA